MTEVFYEIETFDGNGFELVERGAISRPAGERILVTSHPTKADALREFIGDRQRDRNEINQAIAKAKRMLRYYERKTHKSA